MSAVISNLIARKVKVAVSAISTGSVRSITVKKNILASFILKGISLAISFLLIPVTLDFLDPERYGIWITLNSIVSWIAIFDVGIGNGFRNKFAEALALGDIRLGKSYVSTAFVVLSLITSFLILVFLFINPSINWVEVLNTRELANQELANLVQYVFVLFCFQFVFKLISMILLADQKAWIADLIAVSGSLLSLCIIICFSDLIRGSITSLACILTGAPLLAMIIAGIVLFTGKYRAFSPSLKFVKLSYSKDIIGLGVQFFIPQLSSLIIFCTSNLIISQQLGPAEVTIYNIAYKYFSIPAMCFQILLTPYWSAFTEAYFKNDFIWMGQSVKRLIVVWLLFSLFTILLLFASDYIYLIWVGSKIEIPFVLSATTAAYTIISSWNSVFVTFNSGVSKVRLQILLSIFATIVFIPVTFLSVSLLGIAGIPLSMTLAILIGTFVSPFQTLKLINGTASGVWNR